MPQQSTPLEHINAPYNFVPLAEQVVTPEWADFVSHDLPLKEGVSGSIRYTLTALSPLLVGGAQTKNKDGSTTVDFFRTPTAEVAIPGSSLKGMIRAVLEIVTFSRMAQVDDKRYGLRDISGHFVADSYAERVRGRVQFGLMQLRDGEPAITPCDMARFSHRDLEKWWGISKPMFKKRTSVKDKYATWDELCRSQGLADPFQVPFQFSGDTLTGFGGPTIGFPVLTGQISDSTDDKINHKTGQVKSRGKYHDFMFHSPRRAETFSIQKVNENAWRDFLFIHGDEDGKPDMSWPGFWKRRFWNGEPVPVFYIRDGDRLQIGLAYMPKLAGDFSVREMIGHSGVDHLQDERDDMATLIFGRVGKTAKHCLKGRVQFELATPEGEVKVEEQPAAILSSPKPTYFPNYIAQEAAGPAWKLKGGERAQYATYLETSASKAPKLRGWKRYPARPDGEIGVQEPNGPDQVKNKKIQLHLRPLASGCRFSGRLHFQNLRPEELGALLWSLSLGDTGARHSLGMGKPFGFGQVRLSINSDDAELTPNDPAAQPFPLKDYEARFFAYMDKKLNARWEDTPQIRNLTLMANTEHRTRFPGQLEHMVLARLPDPDNPGRKINRNDFTEAKQVGLTLAPYSAGGGRGLSKKVSKDEWPAAPVKFDPGSRTITVYHEGQTAIVSGDATKPILEALSAARLKKLKKGGLLAKARVSHIGGNNWTIVALDFD